MTLEPETSRISAMAPVSLAEQINTGLVYRTLELVIKGYKTMSEGKNFQVKWKENKFSAVLAASIRSHCRELSKRTHQSWSVIREAYHDDENITNGESDPDTAPRIDIVIQSWDANYEEIRFPFECKRIADDKPNLIRFYIEKGLIDRYLTKKDYSAGLPWGGMIGYILHGDHSTIALKLNKQIDRQRGLPTEYLTIQKPIAQFKAIYSSSHVHPERSQSLIILHLLLPFSDMIEDQ